jgi:hypothetical protein
MEWISMRGTAGALARIVLLGFCTAFGLFASTITYTLVESLGRMSQGDQPTATWVAVTSGYINGALTFSGPPTLNAAATGDNYVVSGSATLHNIPGSPYYLLTGIDLSSVEIAIGSNFAYGTNDTCANPQSGTACNITNIASYQHGSAYYYGFAPDSLTVTDNSVPEPGTGARTACGCLMLCSFLWFGRRSRRSRS